MLWPHVDISPYEFACDGPVLGIPHGWNVLTNVPFILLGLWQLRRIRRLRAAGHEVSFLWTGIWISTMCVGPGSMAYHVFLNPLGLGLDRFAIASLIAFLLAWTADVALGLAPSRRWTTVLVLASLGTVAYWLLGGTAWIYGALQAGGSVFMLVCFIRADIRRVRGLPPLDQPALPLYLFSACYGLAKVFEILDAEFCEWTGGVIGGHPFKHLWAALGLLLLSRMMGPRDPA